MTLQKSFRGLPDHIGRFEGGNLKLDVDQFVKLGISAEDFITPGEFVTQSGTLTAVGQVAALPTPDQNEFHRYRWIGFRFIDTNSTEFYVPVFSDDGSRFFGIDMFPARNTTVNNLGYYGYQFRGQEGFVVRPTQSLGFALVTASGAVSADFTVIGFRQSIKF